MDIDDKSFMRIALVLAEEAAGVGEVPVGAVVTYNGTVVSKAYNCREQSTDATAHAEILAIRKACEALGRWRLTGCTLYVTLEPCPMCAGAILQARIDRVVFGADDLRAGAMGSVLNLASMDTLNHVVRVTAGVYGEESRALLKSFFVSRRDN